MKETMRYRFRPPAGMLFVATLFFGATLAFLAYRAATNGERALEEIAAALDQRTR